MCFAKPEYLVFLLLLIPFAVVLGYGVMREVQSRQAIATSERNNGIIPSLRFTRLVIRYVLLFVVAALLLLALAVPRFCSQERLVMRRGADVLFMLDVSRSMFAQDVVPSRLEQAKQEIRSISANLHDARRALLLFAGAPLVQCPLTHDKEGFETLLTMASPDLIEEQGTVFHTAFELASTLLEPSTEQHLAASTKGEKVIVLLSDGEDHEGQSSAVVQQLYKAGVRFFVIGVGSNRPTTLPLPEGGVKYDAAGRVVMSSFHGETLQALARDAGGVYKKSTSEQFVGTDIANTINQLAAASRWVTEAVERDDSLVRYFIGTALLLLLIETMLRKYGARLW